MADACLAAIGVPTTAAAVAEHYGWRGSGGLIDLWLVDEVDADAVDRIEAAGVPCRAVPTMMTDATAAARLAEQCLLAAARIRSAR
jgi:LPPG:FO 2-phospho-L-lactate transferase